MNILRRRYWRGFIHGWGTFYLIYLISVGDFYRLSIIFCLGIIVGAVVFIVQGRREANRWSAVAPPKRPSNGGGATTSGGGA